MLTILLITLIIILAVLLTIATHRLSKYQTRLKQRGLFSRWPIPKINADEFDPAFKTGRFGPSRDTEIQFIAAFRVHGGISDLESWILCVLAKKAQRIFEFGTCTGKTTYLLAANAPASAEIITLTLPPESDTDYQKQTSDTTEDTRIALEESSYNHFLYEGSDAEQKITQLFGDSKTFDESPYAESCDLIFIDGSHAYSYVCSDTEKALRMLKPGGVLIWHDYRGPGQTKGVYRALNEFSTKQQLNHIAGTSFVAYRKPRAVV